MFIDIYCGILHLSFLLKMSLNIIIRESYIGASKQNILNILILPCINLDKHNLNVLLSFSILRIIACLLKIIE